MKCYLEEVFKPRYEAKCIHEPVDGVELAGSEFTAKWSFKNTGRIAWPEGVEFKQVGGDKLDVIVAHESSLSLSPGG